MHFKANKQALKCTFPLYIVVSKMIKSKTKKKKKKKKKDENTKHEVQMMSTLFSEGSRLSMSCYFSHNQLQNFGLYKLDVIIIQNLHISIIYTKITDSSVAI